MHGAVVVTAALVSIGASLVAGPTLAADDMPLGAPTAPPLGYVDLCARTPAQCIQTRTATPSQIEAVQRWAAQTRWAVIFARSLGTENPPISASPLRATAATSAEAPAIDAHALITVATSRLGPQGDLPLIRAFQNAPLLDPAPDRDATVAAPPIAPDWAPPRFVANLTDDQLDRINRGVNRAVRPGEDRALFGQAEYWTVPQGPRPAGDCEDYVLAKREALIAAGAPAEALSIAVVRTRAQELHTVLLVSTPDGEVVLDNLTPWILPWRNAPYQWLERQARGSALTWVAVAT